MQGNTAAMSNVVLSLASGQTGVSASGATNSSWTVRYMKVVGGDVGLQASAGATLAFNNIDFGAVTYHMLALSNATLVCTGNYTISGSAVVHFFLQVAGVIMVSGRTITITGTPAFSSAFLNAQSGSACSIVSNTFSGSATGARYNVTGNSVASTGAATLPGGTAGTTATGGQYL